MSRLKVLTGVAAYIAAFIWAYHSFLNAQWAYWGFADNDPTPASVLLACAIAMIPTFWLPIRLSRPSGFVLWAVFITVIVPSVIIPVYAAEAGKPAFPLIWTMVAGFAVLSAVASLPLLQFPDISMRPWVFWALFGVVSLAIVLDVLWAFRGNMRLVSLFDVYGHRLESRAVEGGFADYGTWWLAYAFDPLLLAYGLLKKQRSVFLVGALGQVFVYSTSSMRSVVLLIAILPGIYMLLRRGSEQIGPRIAWASAVLTALSTLAIAWGVFPFLASMILFRTLGIPGLMSYLFYEYFSVHGYTYWSHVRIISRVIPYPYSLPIPYLIGRDVYGNEALSANAHFLATDGLAAAGLPGLILIAATAGLVLYMADVLAKRHDRLFLIMLLAGPLVALLNVGLFTTLLTDGLGVLLGILTVMPPVRRDAAPALASRQSRWRVRRQQVLLSEPMISSAISLSLLDRAE